MFLMCFVKYESFTYADHIVIVIKLFCNQYPSILLTCTEQTLQCTEHFPVHIYCRHVYLLKWGYQNFDLILFRQYFRHEAVSSTAFFNNHYGFLCGDIFVGAYFSANVTWMFSRVFFEPLHCASAYGSSRRICWHRSLNRYYRMLRVKFLWQILRHFFFWQPVILQVL